jgi:hypothetical protein
MSSAASVTRLDRSVFCAVSGVDLGLSGGGAGGLAVGEADAPGGVREPHRVVRAGREGLGLAAESATHGPLVTLQVRHVSVGTAGDQDRVGGGGGHQAPIRSP